MRLQIWKLLFFVKCEVKSSQQTQRTTLLSLNCSSVEPSSNVLEKLRLCFTSNLTDAGRRSREESVRNATALILGTFGTLQTWRIAVCVFTFDSAWIERLSELGFKNKIAEKITLESVNKDFGFNWTRLLESLSVVRAEMLCQIRGLHLMVRPFGTVKIGDDVWSFVGSEIVSSFGEEFPCFGTKGKAFTWYSPIWLWEQKQKCSYV